MRLVHRQQDGICHNSGMVHLQVHRGYSFKARHISSLTVCQRVPQPTGVQGIGVNNPVPPPLHEHPGLTSAAREFLKNPGAALAAPTYTPASGGSPANYLAHHTQGLQTKDIMNNPPTEKLHLGENGCLQMVVTKTPSQSDWTKWMMQNVVALTLINNGVSAEEAAFKQQLKPAHLKALVSITSAAELQSYLDWAMIVLPSTTWASFHEFDLSLREEIKQQGTSLSNARV